MDTIKNLLSSHKQHNDESIVEPGQTTGATSTTGGLSGEGSHLAQTHNTSPGIQSGLTGQGNHLAQAQNAPTGATSGLTGNQSSGVVGPSGTSGEHHLGRDATVGAGGVGLAQHEHRKHENERGLNPTTGGYGGNTESTGYSSGTTGTNDTSGHHFGRDAAAVGTAGAVGEGIHHRENEQGRGLGGNSEAGYGSLHTTGATGTIPGPHATDTANRLDPSVNTRGAGIEDAHHHSATHGGGAEAADSHHHLGRDTAIGAGGVGLAEHEHHKHQNEHAIGAGTGTSSNLGQSETGQNTTSSGHHIGRDAVVGAGGVGLAEHEHRKHENERGLDSGATSGIIPPSNDSSLPGPAPNTSGPHSKDWMNKLDPRVDSKTASTGFAGTTTGTSSLPSREGGSSSEHQGHHLGRDAAVAGGVGGAAFETDKHFKHDKDLTQAERDAKREHKHELKEEKREHKDHHYGRDAAVGGGIGGAAYEAEKHHHKHEANEPISGQTTSGTTSGSLSHPSNIANRADPDYSNDSHFGTGQQHEHHLGRDAAIAGGVGGTAYEADKHRKHDKDLTQSERDAKKEEKRELKEEKREHKDSKGGILGFLHRDKNKKYSPEEEAEFDRQEREHGTSHKGRDAALGAGAVGAAGVAEHEHRQHHATENVDNNKPLPTAPGNHGIGTGAGTQNALASENPAGEHHYGRDATLGAGAVGAAGVAEHEHKEHQGAVPLAEKPVGTDLGDKLHGVDRNRGVQDGASGYGARSEATTDQHGNPVTSNTGLGATGQYDNNTSGSGLTGQHRTAHHIGRDAPALGGAGLVGEHEYRKHDTTSGITGSNTQSGFTGSNTQSGVSGSNTSGYPSVTDGEDGRHRLHKDPPADHPAAQYN